MIKMPAEICMMAEAGIRADGAKLHRKLISD